MGSIEVFCSRKGLDVKRRLISADGENDQIQGRLRRREQWKRRSADHPIPEPQNAADNDKSTGSRSKGYERFRGLHLAPEQATNCGKSPSSVPEGDKRREIVRGGPRKIHGFSPRVILALRTTRGETPKTVSCSDRSLAFRQAPIWHSYGLVTKRQEPILRSNQSVAFRQKGKDVGFKFESSLKSLQKVQRRPNFIRYLDSTLLIWNLELFAGSVTTLRKL